MKTHRLLLILLATLMASACQDDEMPAQPSDDSPQEERTMHTVQIMDNSFSPRDLTISEGDTVFWVNNGSMIHTSTSGADCEPDGTWNSGELMPDETFSYTFTSQGAFNYFCIPHCDMGMTGSIIVEE